MVTVFTGDVRKANHYLCALLEDLNLVVLTAVFALAVSVSPWVLLPSVLAELIYVYVVGNMERYRSHVCNAEHRDVPLLVLMLTGTFIIMIFGFRVHDWFPNSISHSQSWEFGALCWTACFAFYYWLRLGTCVSDKALKAAGVLILLVLPSLTLAAGGFLWFDKPRTGEHSLPFHFLHVICVALIGIVLLLTDWMLARQSREHRQKRQLYESVWMADVPIVVAFLVLIGFATLHVRHDCGNPDCPDLLLSGAITFQLIASNVMFILLQFDVLERMRLRIQHAAATAAGR